MTTFSDNQNCSAIRELLSISLDEKLSEIEERRLARHLSNCNSCEHFGAELEAISGALASSLRRKGSAGEGTYRRNSSDKLISLDLAR